MVGYLARLGDLLAADLALQPEAEAIVEADRITRYLRDLPRLVHNFVAFRDFYSRLAVRRLSRRGPCTSTGAAARCASMCSIR
jgi:hypothetical protein